MRIIFVKFIKFFTFLFLILLSLSFFSFFYFSNYTYQFNSNFIYSNINIKNFSNFFIDINIDLSKYTKEEIYQILFESLKKNKAKNIYNEFNNYIFLKLKNNSLNYNDSYFFFNEILNKEINKNYFLKYYLKFLKILKKDTVLLNIRINLYNFNDFKIKLADVIYEKILIQKEITKKNKGLLFNKLLIDKSLIIYLLNFFPDDYFQNINAKVNLYIVNNRDNRFIEVTDLKIQNKYFNINSNITKEKANLYICSNINYFQNNSNFYNLKFSFSFKTFPIFYTNLKLNLPFLSFKNNRYILFLKNLNIFFYSIFKNEYNLNFSLNKMIFEIYNLNNLNNNLNNNQLNLNRININNININSFYYSYNDTYSNTYSNTYDVSYKDFNKSVFLKIFIKNINIKDSKGNEKGLYNLKVILKILFNKDFVYINDYIKQNKIVFSLDYISFYDILNYNWKFNDIICYINDFDYNNKYFDIDVISKNYRFSLSIKKDNFNFIYVLNKKNYVIIENNKSNSSGVLSLSIKNILNIINSDIPYKKNYNINKFASFLSKEYFNNDIIYIIFKKLKNKLYKDFNSYNFSIVFSNSFFNGILSFKDLNNYKLFSNYLFDDINFIKTIYLKNTLNNGNLLSKILTDRLFRDLVFYGNVYLTKEYNNFEFSVFSLLSKSNVFGNIFVVSFFRLNNLKFTNFNIIADVFNNYFSIFSKDSKKLAVQGFVLDFNKLLSYKDFFLINLINLNEFKINKQNKFDFSFNFDIFSKKINNLTLFIDKFCLYYKLNSQSYVSLLLDKFFIKYRKPVGFIELNKIFNNKGSSVFVFSKYFISNFLLNNKTLILGNLKLKYFYYKNKHQNLREFNLFTYKLFNDNLKTFVNIYNNFSILNINLDIISKGKNYISKGIILFYGKYLLFKNLYANFNINFLLDTNNFLINNAYFNGNFLINNLIKDFNKNNLFNFNVKIEKLNSIYLLNLVLNYNVNSDIDYFRGNLLTTIDIKDINKNIINLNYDRILDYDKIWQKTYFNLDFDNNFWNILNYLKSTYDLDFIKFLYLKDYRLNLVKTPEIFLVKLNSINNNILNLKLNLSSDKKDTFLYLDYIFNNFRIFNLSVKINNYSLLYLHNLLSINNKDIDLDFKVYPFSINLISIYSDIFFRFSFFYDFYSDDFSSSNSTFYNYNIPFFSFNYNGSIFLDNLKKINKIKINSIKFNINLRDLYVFTFNKFKIIDLAFDSNLELKFENFYVDLVDFSYKDGIYKILNNLLKSNNYFNLVIDSGFYFVSNGLKNSDISSTKIYLASFNKINIKLDKDKYFSDFDINIPFNLLKTLLYKYINLNIKDNNNIENLLDTVFISIKSANLYFDKNNIYKLISDKKLFDFFTFISNKINIKLYGLYFYYNFDMDIKFLPNKNYNFDLDIKLFENNNNFAFIKLNDVNFNEINIKKILSNSEIYIQKFQLITKILNSNGNFYLNFKNSQLKLIFEEFNLNIKDNNLKINGILDISLTNENFIVKNYPNILLNDSVVNYNMDFNNKKISLSFDILNLKKIKVNIFDYVGNLFAKGLIEFKNNKFNVDIFVKANKGELKILKISPKDKNLFVYNYIDSINITLDTKNIRTKNIIWDVLFNSNLNIDVKNLRINGNLKISKGILRLNDGVYRIIQGRVNWNNDLYGDIYLLAQKLGTSPFDYKLTFVKGSIKDFIISIFNLYQKEGNYSTFFNNFNNNLPFENNLSFGLNNFMGFDFIDYSNNKKTGYLRVGKEVTKNIFVFYLRKLKESNFENLDYDYYISIDYLIKRFSKGILLFNTTFYNNSKNNFGFIFVYGF